MAHPALRGLGQATSDGLDLLWDRPLQMGQTLADWPLRGFQDILNNVTRDLPYSV
jgi:hypothetical protein